MDNYLKVIYEILLDLDDIKDTLERGISITNILSPPFDPFKTIGRECQGLTLGFCGFWRIFQGFLNIRLNFTLNVIL